MKLTPQQEFAVEKFKKQRVAALFMEMGTGKTLTALTLANLHADRYDFLLWLAPVSTLANAEEEILKHGGAIKPIIFKGYESIASSSRIYLELLRKLKDKRVFMVCDESLFLKNGYTKRWGRTKAIRDDFAEFCILLNGTPMSRDEMDIYWQMELLSPLIFNMNEATYRSTLFTKITVKKVGRSKHTFYKRCQINLPWLKSKIAPYVYECDLSLPVVVDEKQELYRVTDYTRVLYEEHKKNLIKAIKNYDENGIMGELSMMKHLVASDRLKNDAIAKYISGKRLIVFCEYRAELERISSQTVNGAYTIDGDTPMDERHEIIRNWKKGDKPLVMMTRCGSFGLNMQEADTVIFASLPWDYAVYTQAIHRVYRLGQVSKKVKVIHCMQRIGIMRMVEECLWKKTTLAQFVKEINWKEELNKMKGENNE